MLFLLQFTLLLCKVLSLLRQIIVQILLKFFMEKLPIMYLGVSLTHALYYMSTKVSETKIWWVTNFIFNDLDGSKSKFMHIVTTRNPIMV